MKTPDKMTDSEMDIAIARLGNAAATVGGEERIGYEAEIFAMVRRVRREGTPQQISAIREHIRFHRGQDHRPYIQHVMGWTLPL